MKLNVALTGNFGSGKSTILNFFKVLGWDIDNVDNICHKLYSNKNIKNRIIEQFKPDVVTIEQEIDKTKLSNLIFDSKIDFKKLTNILYPELKSRILDIVNNNVDNIRIFEIPLLFENNFECYFDCIITVWINSELRYERLLKNGWTILEIKRRLKLQIDNNDKLERSNYGIINNWSVNCLFMQCKHLHEHFMHRKIL